MSCILIIGGDGFLGSHLTETFINEGYNTRIVSRTKKDTTKYLLNRYPSLEYFQGDINNPVSLKESLHDVTDVFHFGHDSTPASSRRNPMNEIDNSLKPILNFIDYLSTSEIDTIHFPSSGGTIYGQPKKLPVSEKDCINPINPYGISKAAIEFYLRYYHLEHQLNYSIMRISNPYGERQNPNSVQGVIPIFLNNIQKGKKITIYGDGMMIRDYIYVSDVIEGIMSIYKSKRLNETVNIGSGIGTSLNELIHLMKEITQMQVFTEYKPKSASYVEKIFLDNSLLSQYTGWQPKVNIDQGIEKTWQWIQTLNG